MVKLLTPKNDYVFKRLFTQDTELLKDLINSVLKLPPMKRIKSVEVRNPEIQAEDITKKFIVLDILAVNESGGRYDIEMQVRKYACYPERALYYLCKMYADQLKSGEDYDALNPVMGIHFLDYVQFPDNTDFRYSFLLRDTRYPELRLTDKLAIHIFELPGIEKALAKQKDDPALEWLHFFNHAHEEKEDTMKEHYKNPIIHKAFDVLQTLSADEEIRHRAEVRRQCMINEAILMAGEREKGREEGREEGKEEGRKQTAMKLLKMGVLGLEQIAEASEMSVEEVEQLNRDLQD